MKHDILLHDAAERRWLRFSRPSEIISADHPDLVKPALNRIEKIVAADNRFAVGFITYEAAPAFDAACRVHTSPELPLLWFGIYPEPEIAALPAAAAPETPPLWTPAWCESEFTQAVAAIRQAIAAGETYQVNLTFPLTTAFKGSSLDFFSQLVQNQRAGFAAYLDLGRYAVCSASPELFFRREGERLVAKPMKGTMRRGLTADEDLQLAARLQQSAKDRAENIMVLDMVRNDLSRLSGSAQVRTSGVCELEKYPTVWQLTSTVETETTASLAEIMTALFPCASITGAPKYRTMEIIHRLEKQPRGVYTGCIGYLGPAGRAQFNVAIRTAVIDHRLKTASYGVGAGITWDSRPAAEYQECLAKARILSRPLPNFDLFETLRWTPRNGYFLLRKHIRRMGRSAAYFDFPWDQSRAIAALAALVPTFGTMDMRVRLRLAADGQFHCAAEPAPSPISKPVSLGLAARPIDAANPFYYHKTTCRGIYEAALVGKEEHDDVVLWNPAGEVTETTTSNLVVDQAGRLLTPPISSGLLGGTLRGHLLARGEIHERPITLEELQASHSIFLINSLRGWRKAVLAAPP